MDDYSTNYKRYKTIHRENVAALILFFTTSAKDMKVIFDNYAYALPKDEIKDMIKEMKNVKYSHLDFSLRHPYEITLVI